MSFWWLFSFLLLLLIICLYQSSSVTVFKNNLPTDCNWSTHAILKIVTVKCGCRFFFFFAFLFAHARFSHTHTHMSSTSPTLSSWFFLKIYFFFFLSLAAPCVSTGRFWEYFWWMQTVHVLMMWRGDFFLLFVSPNLHTRKEFSAARVRFSSSYSLSLTLFKQMSRGGGGRCFGSLQQPPDPESPVVDWQQSYDYFVMKKTIEVEFGTDERKRL